MLFVRYLFIKQDIIIHSWNDHDELCKTGLLVPRCLCTLCTGFSVSSAFYSLAETENPVCIFAKKRTTHEDFFSRTIYLYYTGVTQGEGCTIISFIPFTKIFACTTCFIKIGGIQANQLDIIIIIIKREKEIERCILVNRAVIIYKMYSSQHRIHNVHLLDS